MNIETIFVLFNRLYKSYFPLYKLFYFAYKRYSDRDKISLIKSHVKPGMTVLDVGANIGFYTILLSQSVGKDGAVYAFEPDEDNFKYLKQLTRNLGNIKLVQAACGEKNETAYLYKSEKLNVDHHVYKSGESRKKVEVKMISVDEFLKNEKNGFGFVKIDVQGYECSVFKGMKETLARSSNALIISELWFYGLMQAGSSADEYLSEVAHAGFDLDFHSKDTIKDFSSYSADRGFYVDFIARRKK
jgi:FkbM family methyltransferase